MVGTRVLSPLLKISSISKPSNLLRSCRSFSTSAETGKSKTLARKVIPVLLISLTGGIGLSALDDLLIYHQCSSKAIEKASQHPTILNALGEPILRGPWYNASLAVAHRRSSVSCTFPVSGPQGTGIFQLKAVRHRGKLWHYVCEIQGGVLYENAVPKSKLINASDDSWFPYLGHRDWDILIMEALLHVPVNEEKHQTFRISLSDNIPLPTSTETNDCSRSQESVSPEKK